MPNISNNRLNQLDCVHGLDVSNYQTNIDWIKVKSQGFDFAFIKLTEGHSGGFEGDKYNVKARAAEAIKRGVKISYYHFARPGNIVNPVDDAVLEAQYFLNNFKKNGFPFPNFPLVLDIEHFTAEKIVWMNENGIKAPTKTQVKTYTLAFIDELKRNNFPTIVYSYGSFINENFPTNHGLGNNPLWLAAYPLNPETTNPALPVGWSNWQIWQYTERGSIDGVGANLDLNVMKRSFYNTAFY